MSHLHLGLIGNGAVSALIDDRGRVRYVDDMRQQRHRQDMPQAAPRTPRSPGF